MMNHPISGRKMQHEPRTTTKVTIIYSICRRFRVLQLGLRGAPDDESAEDLRAEDTVDLRGLL